MRIRLRSVTKKKKASRTETDGLSVDGVSLSDIAAEFGTPAYVYSAQQIVSAYRQYDRAFGTHKHLVCYAVKANPANSILSILANESAGFDIVSGGELIRVLQAGGDPANIIFSGVGKMDDEINAALDVGIRSINVESASELMRLDRLAREKKLCVPIALRVNPDVTADTHPHIATGGSEHKFGIPAAQIVALAARAKEMQGVALHGLAMHIGSQITDLQPLLSATKALRQMALELRKHGIDICRLDLGGGLGVSSVAPARESYVSALLDVFKDGDDFEYVIEPGRSMVADAGVLLCRVIQLKQNEQKSFAIVDAGMNDFMRPTLYDAYHEILNVSHSNRAPVASYDVVGPICESGDTLGKNRRLAVREGSLLAIMSAGAYGATMSSHYNSRPRCAEITIEDGKACLTRQRETMADLCRNEKFMTHKTA
ncbi:MAG: diaminopimelate decarboxylase [Gammaproteobacteria bacterium]|nr:diaminopimelate decarboxylase [Gammaproteobacteria bacterium]